MFEMMQIEMIGISHLFVANTQAFLVLETNSLSAPAMPGPAISETVARPRGTNAACGMERFFSEPRYASQGNVAAK